MKTTFSLLLTLLLVSGVNAQVYPQQDGDVYSLKFKNVEIQVDASRGAKVSSLKIDDDEYLYNDRERTFYGQDCYWGSSFWLSPEEENIWPPFPLLDDDDYTVELKDTLMIFTSRFTDIDNGYNNFRFIKTFWMSEQDTSINIRYAAVNTSDNDLKKALWEVTRVKPEGLSFWLKDNDPYGVSGLGNISEHPVLVDDYYWMQFSTDVKAEAKFYFNTKEGWVAHVNDSRQMFIKSYKDISTEEVAPGEDQNQYWVAKDHAFIELENESSYKNFPAKDTIYFNIKWQLRNVPENIDVSAGSEDLLKYAKSLADKAVQEEFLTIKEKHNYKSLKVYPTPAIDLVYFDIPDFMDGELSIFDISSTKVLEASINSRKVVDVSQLTSGLYFYTVYTSADTYKGKFVVK